MRLPTPTRLSPLVLAALLAPAAQSQELSIFSQGQVLVADAGGLAASQPAGLTGIELLPLDFTLHSPLEAWDPNCPSTVPLPNGASAVRVPGHGAIYGFSRSEQVGATYGFFRVRPDGRAEVLLESAGTGPLGDQSPFVPRIAVAPANDALLMATHAPAGGDLYELDLTSGAVTNRTAGLAPFDFGPAPGLALTHGQGFAATGSELVRFDRVSGAAGGVPLALPSGMASHVPGDFARSADGHGLALVAGTGPGDEYVFVIGANGAVVRVTDVGGEISPGGYLPEVAHGPFFALSADSSHVGWRTVVPVPAGTTTEGWLQATGAATGAPLTGDELFLDTLDEIAPFAFFDATRLLMGVGELDGLAVEGIDAVDLFTVRLGEGGTPEFENLTLSSGVASPPFFAKPLISPGGLRRIPGSDHLVVQDEKQNLLLIARPGGPPVVIEPAARKLRFDVASGGHALLGIERDDPFDDMRVVRLDFGAQAAATLALLPKETELLSVAARGDGWLGAVAQIGPNQWALGVDLQTGFAQLTLPQPVSAGPTLDIATNGDLLLSSGPLGTPAVFARDPLPGAPSLIGIAPLVGFLLPR